MGRSDWLSPLGDHDENSAHLIAFHHSGGGARFFRPWKDHLSQDLNLWTIELPGRGNRFVDPLIDSLPVAARAVAEVLSNEPRLSGGPVILFGHSLGAFLAYEVAMLREYMGKPVDRLVCSGALPPDEARVDELRHTMSDAELLDELRRFNATPAEVLEHEELMALLLPIIRSDFKMLETYEPGSREPLQSPITAIAGRSDSHVQPSLDGWTRYTRADLTVQWFDGGHFFLDEDKPAVLGWLASHLRDVTD